MSGCGCGGHETPGQETEQKAGGCGCGGHGHGGGRGHGRRHGGGCGCGGHGPRVDEREEVLSEGRENLGLRAATAETPATGGCGCGSHS